jgi:hypothetical protein
MTRRGPWWIIGLPLSVTLVAADSPMRIRMRDHAALADAAQSSVIASDLAGARAAGQRLAELSPDNTPDRLEPGLPKLVLAARALAAAPDLAAAGAAVGALGSTCGSCHAATGGGPRADRDAVPSALFSETAEMARHRWAADWLWLGLIAPSDPAWTRGVDALSAAPPPPGPRGEPGARAFADARQAVTAATTEEARGTAYGALVASCAGCHAHTSEMNE